MIECTDDYPYVCNVKTGAIRVPKELARDLGFDCEVIENAASVWEEKVHPDDKHAFLEANRDVVDDYSKQRQVTYRIQNHEGDWVWLSSRGSLMVDRMGQPELFAGIIARLKK